jgi:hypothetical protein
MGVFTNLRYSLPPTPTVDRKAGTTKGRGKERGWGGRAVLVLFGIRLSLDGVNPVYCDTIKVRLPSPGGVFHIFTYAQAYRHYTHSPG